MVSPALLITAALAIAGCVEHRVTAPQLDTLVAALQGPACPALAPIPERMLIHLDGHHDVADAAGEAFLRQYARARSCWRGVRGHAS